MPRAIARGLILLVNSTEPSLSPIAPLADICYNKNVFKLLLPIVSGILGLWLADKFVAGVEFAGNWQSLTLAGLILGLINFFVKPILRLITLPIRLVTLGLFGLLINIIIIWAVDIIFAELIIKGIVPLLWTTLIIWGLGTLLQLLIPKKKNA